MTEPHAGADPTLFTTRAERDGDEWVINGYKWFSSNARFAEFLIVMVVTNPEVSAYQGMSMFIVPANTPGVNIIRNVGTGTEPEEEGSHAYIHYDNVRVPADHVLGGEGQAFAIAQTRLGGGRIHHAMRTIARVRQAFDMMCERALARQTRTGPLASLQMTQERIADSWIEIEQFRLLVLRTAWLIDRHNDYRRVRKDISAIKAAMPKVLYDVVQRSMHLHGSLGISNEMPFSHWMVGAEVARARRRPHRDPQGGRGPPGTQGVPAPRRPVPERPSPDPSATPPGRSTPTSSNAKPPSSERPSPTRQPHDGE